MAKAQRILVVDDDAAHASTIADILESIGYAVDVANDGFKALGFAKAKRYDYALLDIRMPGMNGVDVLKKLRSETSDPPEILMMTAYRQDSIVQEARDEGAVAVLEKPLDIPYLIKYFADHVVPA
jgi:two-component system response regulator (stage 0 sporulation protein F)